MSEPKSPPRSKKEGEVKNQSLDKLRGPDWAGEFAQMKEAMQVLRGRDWPREFAQMKEVMQVVRGRDWAREFAQMKEAMQVVRGHDWAREFTQMTTAMDALRGHDWARELAMMRSGMEALQAHSWARELATMRSTVEALRAHDWTRELNAMRVASQGARPWGELFLSAQYAVGAVQAPGMAVQAAVVAHALAARDAGGGTLAAQREQSFLVDAVACLHESPATADDFAFSLVLDRVFDSFLSHIAHARTWIEQRSALILLVLAVLILYYQRASYLNDLEAVKSPDVIARSIQEGTAKVAEKLDMLAGRIEAVRAIFPAGPPVVVTRNAIVRSGAGRDRPVVGKLTKGDLAEVLDRDGDWLRVTYYDALPGTPRQGWIHSRLTRPLRDEGRVR
jgi:hypothetical protein